ARRRLPRARARDARRAGRAGAARRAARAPHEAGRAVTQPIEHLTAKQHEELKQELAELEARRPGIVQAIKVAREFGDLSENFEYHAAKNEQGLLEARIRTLRSRLDNAVVVAAAGGGVLAVGSVVELEEASGERMRIEISSVGGAGAVSP